MELEGALLVRILNEGIKRKELKAIKETDMGQHDFCIA